VKEAQAEIEIDPAQKASLDGISYSIKVSVTLFSTSQNKYTNYIIKFEKLIEDTLAENDFTPSGKTDAPFFSSLKVDSNGLV
jgi:hypothetical protein